MRLMIEGYMNAYSPINFENKFQRLPEQWSPRVIAEMNDYQFKIARLEGDFIWHHHPDLGLECFRGCGLAAQQTLDVACPDCPRGGRRLRCGRNHGRADHRTRVGRL